LWRNGVAPTGGSVMCVRNEEMCFVMCVAYWRNVNVLSIINNACVMAVMENNMKAFLQRK